MLGFVEDRTVGNSFGYPSQGRIIVCGQNCRNSWTVTSAAQICDLFSSDYSPVTACNFRPVGRRWQPLQVCNFGPVGSHLRPAISALWAATSGLHFGLFCGLSGAVNLVIQATYKICGIDSIA